MSQIIVIIPAFDPLASLVDYVKRLKHLEVQNIIVVNDGSDPKYNYIFNNIREIEDCVVLEYNKNKGKGRALKIGFEYVIKHFPKAEAVLTVGAHEQHHIEDIKRILHIQKLFSDGIILGVRNFHSKELPLISSVGNLAASKLFQVLFHKRILDTQTGLRCIPRKELYWLLNVPGESFNYDTNMLVEAIKRKMPIYEIPIGNVHVKKNSIMNYDEVIQPQKVVHQIVTSYKKNKGH